MVRDNTGKVVAQTPAQSLLITQHTGGTMNWNVSASHPWLQLSQSTGAGSGVFQISVDKTSLPASGSFDGTLAVSSADSSTEPQLITIHVRQMVAGATGSANGSFDTPANKSTNVVGAIPVTGWALDDVGVNKVEIWRDPVNGEPTAANGKVFIGNAVFVAGARPDVESLSPDTPLNYRAGWGYLLLTNVLPDIGAGKSSGGNGTFTLYAYATDAEGHSTQLGSKTITCSNGTATKPFGTLDTPGQGETIGGGSYFSFGWALSPKSTIPADGSTIDVYIDGVNFGHPTYNQRRSDIAGAFPGYANSDGAIGFLSIDTTRLTNGVHTIGWLATDAAGNAEGLGSRFFSVFNGSTGGTAMTAASTATSGAIGSQVGQQTAALASVPLSNAFVEMRRAFRPDEGAAAIAPDGEGRVRVRVAELDQVELRLPDLAGEGYLVVGNTLRPLPSGSALNNGVFTWQPGPGFVGDYDFVFVLTEASGEKTQLPVRVTIAPKR